MNILALTQPGTNSRGVYDDLLDATESLGHTVMRLEMDTMAAMLRALGDDAGRVTEHLGTFLLKLLEDNRIDLTVTMWGHLSGIPAYAYDDGTQRPLLDVHGHPVLHYWWDAPHWFEQGRELERVIGGLYRGDHQYHLINNPATAGEMTELMGFRNVIPSPNGVNPRRFRPQPAIGHDHDLVFVSGPGDPPPTPVMLEELERDDPDVERIRRDVAGRLGPALDRVVGEHVDDTRRAPVRRLLDAMVATRLADRHAPALVHLQRAVASDPGAAEGAPSLLGDLALYVKATDIIRRIEKWERPFTVAYLSRHFRCLRMGEQGYDAWGVRGDASGYVDYDRQSEVYARAPVALNVMRWQDDVGVNSKVFEITACGATCLQMHRGGIETLFAPGREILVASGPGEARELLADALRDREQTAEIAAAGRARTLAEHTWTHRMGAALDLVVRSRAAARSSLTAAPSERLAFILAPMRSGSTLLRRVLDTHPMLAAPPESWFLLPLVNLWSGQGDHPQFKPHQAAVALQSIASRQTFLDACRAFAATVYDAHRPPGGWVIDKTPFYLKIADALPELFPRGRFIVLTRDPRATAWSLFTWDKVNHTSLDAPIRSTAEYVRRQHAFATAHPERTLVVHYEALCAEPEQTCRALCDFLDVTFDPAMIDYGAAPDRPGYGDQNVLRHARPHTESLRRWDGPEGMSIDDQRRVAEACGCEALAFFGYDELAEFARTALTGLGAP